MPLLPLSLTMTCDDGDGDEIESCGSEIFAYDACRRPWYVERDDFSMLNKMCVEQKVYNGFERDNIK